jgi:hypothetical protein
MADIWDTQLKPAASILEQFDQEHVLQSEGGKASSGLWQVLRTMPGAVARCDAPEFLLGYVPMPSVPLTEDDISLLKTWQHALGQCFRWTVRWQDYETYPAEPTFVWGDELVERRKRPFGPLFIWRDEFFSLLDEVDALVTPRIEFWSQQMRGES